MKKLIIFILVNLQVSTIYSQFNQKDISFELRYPVPVGDNFIHRGYVEGYKGVVDVGVDYNVLKFGNLGIGVLFNGTFLKNTDFYDVHLRILSPKIKIEYEWDVKKISIIPNLALGYSHWHFRTPKADFYDNNGIYLRSGELIVNLNGFTFRSGLKLLMKTTKRIDWYVQFAYELTKLEKTEFGDDSNYNRNVQIIYPGVGLLVKL